MQPCDQSTTNMEIVHGTSNMIGQNTVMYITSPHASSQEE
jgi:hypothetical protein